MAVREPGVAVLPHPAAVGSQALRQTAGRLLPVAAMAVLLSTVHLRRPVTLCPLRALTGWPCPLCGGTTAAVQVGAGNLWAAARTAPVLLAVAGAVVAAPLGLGSWWRARSPRWRLAMLVTTVVAAECWQLVRLGVVPT
jgi:hypothetical protein